MSHWEPYGGGGGSGEGAFSSRSQRQYIKRAKHTNYNENVQELFNKKFQFTPITPGLPPSEDCFTSDPWTVKEMEVLKSCLNFHKSQLNDFNIEEWSVHTRRRNPAGDIGWKLRTAVNPEFLTQAWSKFYECAYTYNIIPEQARTDKKMVSLHLCEAPGAFISALNHYLKLHDADIEWRWLANTLNPYYEGNSTASMIADDRFMLHTLQHWHFGVDSTGNLMDWDNSQSIILKARDLGKVMLVTADGSIDCLERPDAQEQVTSPLHYCEVVTAIQALSQDGTLICKLFTIFEHSTINLLYLLNVMFEQVNIYKPVTSKCGNSEVYAVCLKYHGQNQLQPYIEALKSGYGTELYERKSLFPLISMPTEFLKEIEQCAHFFSSLQCNVINNNLQAFLQNTTSNDIKTLKFIVASEFMTYYDIRSISHSEEILKGLMHEENKLNTNPRYHRGSFTERVHYETLSPRDKYETLNACFQSNFIADRAMIPKNSILWLELYDDSVEITLSFTYAKPVTKLNSSKFVFSPILKMYQNMLKEADFDKWDLREEPLSVEEINTKYGLPTDRWKTLRLPDVKFDQFVFLNKLNEVILNMAEGESLFLPNLELLSHFNVGVFYILCKASFKSVGFTDGNGVILGNYVKNNNRSLIRNILEECGKQGDNLSVLRVLPVQVTNVGEFYNNVIFYNNTLYRNKSMYFLSNIQKFVCNV